MTASAYHHGDLRREVLRGAVQEIEANGPAGISMRAIARRAGVSHAAPAHHFGDKAGVLSVIAAEGYRGLAEATEAALGSGDIFEVGRAYVQFALDHRAHFEVMFRPELYRRDDPDVTAARDAAAEIVFRAVRGVLGPDASEEEVLGGVTGAWSFVHGLATLWLDGNLTAQLGEDPEAAFRLGALALARLGGRA
jgi:AcrR family transcriptional regulator